MMQQFILLSFVGVLESGLNFPASHLELLGLNSNIYEVGVTLDIATM